MADSDLVVTISGPALSLLFYENACSDGDEMGFLLGNVLMFVTKKVTDSERQVESIRRHIEITGVLTCPIAGNLYSHTGKVCKDAIKSFVRERGKEIVGWFRFRRNSRLVPTFRDKILHKELASYFNECNSNTPKDTFLACILSTSTTEKKGTHKFRHVLLRYNEGVYRPVPLRIKNLGDHAAAKDGSDYMPTPVKPQLQEPDVFTKFVRSLKLDQRHKSGCELVMTIQRAAGQHLESLIPRVCESDYEVCSLESQVQDLRVKLVGNVMNSEKHAPDNQQINQFNHHVLAIHRSPMEGDQSIKMEMNLESPPRTSNVIEEPCMNKDSSLARTKSTGRPHNVINVNARRSTGDSAQKSPSSRISYSQAAKKNPDSEEIQYSSADG